MSLVTVALAALHVIFGMNFLGAVFVLNVVLGPVILMLSPSTTRDLFSKFWPAMTRFLHITIGGTAIFGILFYAIGGFSSVTGSASTYLDAGIVLGILAMVEAEGLQIPTVNKLVKQMTAEGGSSSQGFTPEQLKVFNRVKTGGIIGLITISLTAIFMVAGAWA
jgi:hypothetical protein